MKLDRIEVLGISGIAIIVSLFLMNTLLLVISLAVFAISAAYNQYTNIKEDKLLDLSKVGRIKFYFVCFVTLYGASMVVLGLLALICLI